MDTENIFIQIASYRDPELTPTIRDCIKNAENPLNLKFCICWQCDSSENLDEFINDERFIILKVPYTNSKGVCWARNKIQQFYNNEKYTLQLDSHHRFIERWDTILINMFNNLKQNGISKPLITAYLPSYDPNNDPNDRVKIPWKIDLKELTEEKQVLCIPSNIDNFKTLTRPIPAKFYSGHFTFTSGDFARDVQHDPELYFTGEEMSITVRAYTYGYDLFHPHIVIAWHEYTRKNRVKQWDDDKEWYKKDIHSKNHYLQIFKKFDKYGLGTQRTVQEYINYSNINFLEEKEYNKYKNFDEQWRNWIKENIDLRVSLDAIRKILINEKFKPDEINKEINFYLSIINYN
jgi:hypothetical protein